MKNKTLPVQELKVETQPGPSSTESNKMLPYLLGLVLFGIALAAGFATYKDYGISWDELDQRLIGNLTYDYVVNGKNDLLNYKFKFYGTGYELPLIFFEKWFHLTDSRDIYEMRHLVNHILFALGAFSLYIAAFRLTRNMVLSSLCFIMLVLSPRIYAHSFMNPKDLPFFSMFLITFSFSQYAFDKHKPLLYLALGALAGYTTSIRVMGILLLALILGFMVLDLLHKREQDKKKALMNVGMFAGGYVVMLYAAWPLLWTAPISNFLESYSVMSHYAWDGQILMRGVYEHATDLPVSYFPTWFSITTPLLWLLVGASGVFFIFLDLIVKFKTFLRPSAERFYLFAALCFIMPVFAVIKLHSVIYDDWRHLYFVWPPFVLSAIYVISKVYKDKIRFVVIGLCSIQAIVVISFMTSNHPYQQVYFNEMVNRDDEALRENYELEYWGCSFKQGLEYLAANDKRDTIKVGCNFIDPVQHNLLMLAPADRKRFALLNDVGGSDYFITNFRGHKEDYPSTNIAYNIKVLNSSIMRIYRIKNIPATTGTTQH